MARLRQADAARGHRRIIDKEAKELDDPRRAAALLRRPDQTELREDVLQEAGPNASQLLGVTANQIVVNVREHVDAAVPSGADALPKQLGHLLRHGAGAPRRVDVAEREPSATHEPTGHRMPDEHAIAAVGMDGDMKEEIPEVVLNEE